MIGLDYKAAPIALREQISLTQSGIAAAVVQLQQQYQAGAVILSTCNRTEVYLASEALYSEAGLAQMFGQTVGVSAPLPCYIKRGQEMVSYLFALGCGLHSMILGEDQIITQVKEALDVSMAQHAGNAPLNTLFRHSITCAKKAKAQVNIQFISPSIVTKALALATAELGGLQGKKVLVIGNGEMGRLAATLFAEAGCEVFITLRRYKYHQTIVPEHCTAVEYDARQALYAQVDIIISATKSPHYTVYYADMNAAAQKPAYLFDLALPRDIEPAVRSCAGVRCFDVDEIGSGDAHYDPQAMAQIEEIIAVQQVKFAQWMAGYQQMQEKECV